MTFGLVVCRHAQKPPMIASNVPGEFNLLWCAGHLRRNPGCADLRHHRILGDN